MSLTGNDIDPPVTVHCSAISPTLAESEGSDTIEALFLA
jgi:hypothetical protein